jgi:hypothetical protein
MSLMRPHYKLVGDAEHLSTNFAEGYDGSAWEFYGDPGIVVRTAGAASAAGRHATSIDGPLIDYRQRGSNVMLKGIWIGATFLSAIRKSAYDHITACTTSRSA